MSQESRQYPDLLEVKLGYLNGRKLLPCGNGCKMEPVTCGVNNGIVYDLETRGSLCRLKQERIIFVDEQTS